MKSLKEYMKKMGFQTARDIRDLLIPEIKSAADLTRLGRLCPGGPGKMFLCGLCVEIGHCNAILLTDASACDRSPTLPGLLHLHRHLPEEGDHNDRTEDLTRGGRDAGTRGKFKIRGRVERQERKIIDKSEILQR